MDTGLVVPFSEAIGKSPCSVVFHDDSIPIRHTFPASGRTAPTLGEFYFTMIEEQTSNVQKATSL